MLGFHLEAHRLERKGEKSLHPRTAAQADEAQELRPSVRHHQDAAQGAAMAQATRARERER